MIKESIKRDELRGKIKNLEKDAERKKIEYEKMHRECKMVEEKHMKVTKNTKDSNARKGPGPQVKADHRNRARCKRHTTLDTNGSEYECRRIHRIN